MGRKFRGIHRRILLSRNNFSKETCVAGRCNSFDQPSSFQFSFLLLISIDKINSRNGNRRRSWELEVKMILRQ